MENRKIFVGIDLAAPPKKWWQRLLVWIGFRNRWTDMCCAVFFEKKPDGSLIIHDVQHF